MPCMNHAVSVLVCQPMRVLPTSSDRCASIMVVLLAIMTATPSSAGDAPGIPEPTFLKHIADNARAPVWSPTGNGIAWVSEVPQPISPVEARFGPRSNRPPPRPVISGGVGIAWPLEAPIRTVTLIHEAPPLRGVAWMHGGTAVVAWDQRQVWSVPVDSTPLAARVLATLEGERDIDGVTIAPDGRSLLVICNSTAAKGMRDGREILVFSADGSIRAQIIGRKPLWAPDGNVFYFSRNDQLSRFTVATGAIDDLLSASYYLTHPFPMVVEPPPGKAHELWPAAVLRDGWLAFDAIEIEVNGHITITRGRSYPFHGERVLWKPAAIRINGKITDYFQSFSEIGRRGERAGVMLTPLDDAGGFLRIESDSDSAQRLGRTHNPQRLKRLLAMKLDARCPIGLGGIASTYDLPASLHVDQEYRGSDGASRGHRLETRRVDYRLEGVAATGGLVLFSFKGALIDMRAHALRSAQGLLWLDTTTGVRKWLELSSNQALFNRDISATPSPDGTWAAMAQHDFFDAKTPQRSVWIVGPDPKLAHPPMDDPYTSLVIMKDEPQQSPSTARIDAAIPVEPASPHPDQSDF